MSEDYASADSDVTVVTTLTSQPNLVYRDMNVSIHNHNLEQSDFSINTSSMEISNSETSQVLTSATNGLSWVNTIPRHPQNFDSNLDVNTTVSTSYIPTFDEHTRTTPILKKPISSCKEYNHYKMFHPANANSNINSHNDQSVNYVVQQQNLKSLNIKFSGNSNVDEFLLKVNDARLSRNIGDATLLQSFTELLDGTALMYYRTIRNNVTSWAHLCHLFQCNFQPINYDFTTEKEIRNTKQSNGQSVFDFITKIKHLNCLLSQPIAESSLLEIIKHNLSPSYAPLLAVNQILTFEQLLAISKNFEAYAIQAPQQKNTTKSQFTTNTTKPINVVNANKNVISCLKCKKLGHSYKNCKTITKAVCFKCGALGVVTKHCTKCNKTQVNQKNTDGYNKQKN